MPVSRGREFFAGNASRDIGKFLSQLFGALRRYAEGRPGYADRSQSAAVVIPNGGSGATGSKNDFFVVDRVAVCADDREVGLELFDIAYGVWCEALEFAADQLLDDLVGHMG